jgi:hypothetical protein
MSLNRLIKDQWKISHDDSSIINDWFRRLYWRSLALRTQVSSPFSTNNEPCRSSFLSPSKNLKNKSTYPFAFRLNSLDHFYIIHFNFKYKKL